MVLLSNFRLDGFLATVVIVSIRTIEIKLEVNSTHYN